MRNNKKYVTLAIFHNAFSGKLRVQWVSESTQNLRFCFIGEKFKNKIKDFACGKPKLLYF